VIVSQPQTLAQVHPQIQPHAQPQNLHDDEEHIHPNSNFEEGTPQEVIPHIRRSTRECMPSTRYRDFIQYSLLYDESEPSTFAEACVDKDKNHWTDAMNDEMKYMMENHAWDLVPLPTKRKALQNKWVYRLKEEAGGKKQYKAILVVKGYAQQEGIDFIDIFSPVVKMSSIKIVLGLVAADDLELDQLDVKTTFLHGDLKEELYMKQPKGFEEKGKENLV